jgi:hypothetical protein
MTEQESAPRCFPYASQVVGWPMFSLLANGVREQRTCPATLRKGLPMKLTKANISRVTVPRGKSEIIVFDDDVPGWGLRVRAGGSATWIFQYRQGSKQRRLTLGSATAISAQNAREHTSEIHARVRLGRRSRRAENRKPYSGRRNLRLGFTAVPCA